MRANVTRDAASRALFMVLMALLVAGYVAVSPAPAATTFTVVNTNDSGSGSLRKAIESANSSPGTDTVRFDIPGSGVKTIRPTSELPAITETVTIDGYSQPGSVPNTLEKGTNATLVVELDGSLAGENASGLTVDERASNVVVRGLTINRFGFTGVEMLGDAGKVEGNFIGTDPGGTLDRGNGDFGGVLVHGDSNTIGGTSRAGRNLVSGNGEGVDLNTRAEGNRVQGNLVGTARDGVSDLGNDGVGVAMVDAERNVVGGVGLGEANTIAFNGDHGVRVVAFNGASRNRISGNSIFSNARLGIDLRGGTENLAGATGNDAGDADAGPNDLQNKPVLTSATTSSGTTTIKGKLVSTPTDPFVVEFFSNLSGNEGKKFIGNKAVSTDAGGNATFTFTPSQPVRAGQNVTATATNVVQANTSEFSTPRKVATP